MRCVAESWLVRTDPTMKWDGRHGSDELLVLVCSDGEAMRVTTVMLSWYQGLLLCSSLGTKARDRFLVKEGEVGR